MKNISISIHREEQKTKQENVGGIAQEREVLINEVPYMNEKVAGITPDSQEDVYAKELEIVLDAYLLFTKTYKDISKQMLNPIKMRKNAKKIYEQLNRLSIHFNQVIERFREQANPPEELQPIHEEMVKALGYFEVYNKEFPDLMLKGNFKRINEVSQGLNKGHKGIREVFEALEERENHKEI